MIQLSKKTIDMLEDLERRIDPEVEDDFQGQWRDFLYDKFDGEIFIPARKKTTTPSLTYPKININDAVSDYELMLQDQLSIVSNALTGKTQSTCIRTNYGTGILSSLFGAEIFIMPYEMNTLPTTRAFNDTEKIRAMVEAGMPNLENGFGKKVFECGELYAEVLAKYPKLAKYIDVYHPDLQGPLDICELLWGGEMFYAMYDEPELVHAAMKLITDTYTAFMERWRKMFPARKDMNPHWAGLWHRGEILLRNDSAMNLSPSLYEEFSVPYDSALLKHFGGGAMHYCGKGDHYIKQLCSMEGLYGVNLSQPQYNDMETIYANTVDKGIKILAFNRDYANKDKVREGGFHHNLHS